MAALQLQEMLKRATEQQQNEFIAEFECNSSLNGVIIVSVTNINTIWDSGIFATCADECMELVYRSMPISIIPNSDPSIDKLWRVKDILICNIHDNGQIAIRVPVYLHSYQFEFGLKTKDTQNDSWWPRSETQTVTIPSFLCEDIHSTGDNVSFRNPLNCRSSNGQIIEELEDGNYKILWTLQSKEMVIHSSKICRIGIEDIMMLSTLNESEMINDLLIRRRDTESKEIFDAVRSHYDALAYDECWEIYGRKEFMFHWEAMSLFVTKNIFDFLWKHTLFTNSTV